MQILTPSSTAELDQIRALMRAFVAWHRQRHVEDLHLIDRYFDPAAFDAELSGLPDSYARPAGQLLLARIDDEPAGCVALRPIDATSCEMKRMFVDPLRQGQGVGRALARQIIDDARGAGYTQLWLDTSVRQTEALGLYRSLGFQTVEPYYNLPAELAGWLDFLRLEL